MTSAHSEISHERCLVEAAAWRSYLTEQGIETTAEFEAWLADSDNVTAWQRVQKSWSFVGEHAASPELLALRHAALEHARREGQGRWTRSSARGTGLLRFAAAASVAAILVAAGSFWTLNKPEVYRTVAGERRVVTLSDGSQVALDAQSEVRVAYSDSSRALTLVRGQARFDVAKNPSRPFTVEAEGTKVVATGTAFNVDLLGAELRVTLIEGRVLVVPPDDVVAANTNLRNEDLSARVPSTVGSAGTIELAPGEQVVSSRRQAPIKVAAVDVDRATSWQQGRLVFENEPLSSVVMRVSRYSQRSLRVEDPEIAALRISGVFRTGDMDGFVATITSYLPVRAETSDDGAISLAPLE